MCITFQSYMREEERRRKGKRKEEIEGGRKHFASYFFPLLYLPMSLNTYFFPLKKKSEVSEIEIFIAMAFVFIKLPLPFLENRSCADRSSRGTCCPGDVLTEMMCRSEAPLATTSQGSLEGAHGGSLSSRSPLHLLRGFLCLCFHFSRGFFHIAPMPRDFHPPHQLSSLCLGPGPHLWLSPVPSSPAEAAGSTSSTDLPVSHWSLSWKTLT